MSVGGVRTWLFAVALCIAPGVRAERSSAAQVEATLRQLNETGAFSGAVVVRRGGEVVYRQGFGLADAEQGVAITPQTPMDAGSMAKPFTAAGVLMLADEGRVRLDDRVRRHLPEFSHTDTTIRQLLTHSAGLPDYDHFQTMLDAGAPVLNIDLVRSLAARGTPSAFKPGSAFAYCNLCYDTLALVIERVSGETYPDFIRSRFLQPAGARHTFVRPARFADWPGLRTKGYRRIDGGWNPNDALDNEGFHGGSNIYFSADDLAALMAAWAKPAGAISRIHRSATASASIGGGQSGIRLGNWYCDEDRVRCHYSGHHQGFHSFGYWDATQHLVVAFTSNGTIDSRLQFGLPRLLISLAEGGPVAPLDRTPVVPDLAWPKLAGTYRVDRIGKVLIEQDKGGATIRVPKGVRSRIYDVGEGWFYVPGLDVYLSRPADRANPLDLQWSSVFLQATGKRIQ